MPPVLHLARFQCDVTPPIGHPLCGGWIEPARAVDDPLELRGIVLMGDGAPIVLAAVDWCGLRNDAHIVWRDALAQAAHTVPENVALQCVHQHNAPFADLKAQEQLDRHPGAPRNIDRKFFDRVVHQSSEALRESLKQAERLDFIGIGFAPVQQVASNRRVLGPDGKVKFTRTSATKDPLARAEPEGLIDPILRTLSFWQGDRALAALHYYATHPMSYYGDGRVSTDFCGLARRKRQEDDPKVFQIYFTGCAGNVTAGKYNDGSATNRPILRDRVYEAMKKSWQAVKRQPITRMTWRFEKILLPPRQEPSFQLDASLAVLRDPQATAARRGNAAFQWSWLQRSTIPIIVSCLAAGSARVLHLPGEPFVEFQLQAQRAAPDREVFIAAYGDGGPGYIPTAEAYSQGGYEPTVSLVAPEAANILTKTIDRLLRAEP
jgi:hypothetical protein